MNLNFKKSQLKINRKKFKYFGQILLVVLIITSLTLPLQAFSDDRDKVINNFHKDEIIYTKLRVDGAVNDSFVINRFSVNQAGEISDYGDYAEIKNLTNDTKIVQANEKIGFGAEPGIFFYQGSLVSHELPWNFSIKYSLNGSESNPENIRGKDGKFTLNLRVNKNLAKPEFSEFHRSFLLQITVLLNADNINNVDAPKAVQAFVGSKKQLTYMVMPDKDADFTLNAEGKNWQPEAIQIAAIPFALNLDIDLPDAAVIAAKFAPLHDGLAELANGMSALADGLTKGSSGAKQLADGLAQLSYGGEGLSNGIFKLAGGITELSNGMGQFAGGLSKATDGSGQLSDGLNKVNSALDAFWPESMLEKLQKNSQSIQILINSIIDKTIELTPENLKKLKNLIGDDASKLGLVQKQLQEIQKFLKELQKKLPVNDVDNSIATANFVAGSSQYISDNEALEELRQLKEDLNGLRATLNGLNVLVESPEASNGNSAGNGEASTGENVAAGSSDTSSTISTSSGAKPSQELQNQVTALMTQISAMENRIDNLTTRIAADYKNANRLIDDEVQRRENLNNKYREIADLARTVDNKVDEVAFGDVNATLDQMIKIVDQIDLYLQGRLTIEEFIKSLEVLRDSLEKTADLSGLLNGLSELRTGINKLANGAKELNDGLKLMNANFSLMHDGSIKAANGAWELYRGFNKYWQGLNQAASGSYELTDGMTKLTDGASRLAWGSRQAADKTANLSPIIAEQMADFKNKLLPDEYQAKSFLDKRNKNITSVQFVFITDVGSDSTGKTKVKTEPKAESLWDRIKALFSKKS